jgi:hypothetical protein
MLYWLTLSAAVHAGSTEDHAAPSTTDAAPHTTDETVPTSLKPASKSGGGKGGKKKGGKKKVGKKSAETRASPWGKAKVIATGGVGMEHFLLQEADAIVTEWDGEEDPSEAAGTDDSSGSSSTSCSGDTCETVDSEKNGVTGWSQTADIRLSFPGLGGLPAFTGPSIGWSRMSGSGKGHPNLREEAGTEGGLQGQFVQDRADYDFTIDEVTVGWLFGFKPNPNGIGFIRFRADIGYGWGTMTTTLDSDPNRPVEGAVKGMAGGFDFGFGLALGKHVQITAVPFTALDVVGLKYEDDDLFPFLTESKSRYSAFSAQLDVGVAF